MLLTTSRLNTYRPPARVDSKPLTQSLSPLDATLTKNQGVGPVIVNQESDEDSCPVEHRDEGSLPRVTSRKSWITKHEICAASLSTFNCRLSASYVLVVSGSRSTDHGTRITPTSLHSLWAPTGSSQTRTASHPATTTAHSSFLARQTI